MLMLWPVGKDCFAAAALAVKELMRLSYCEQALVGGDNLLALATSLQQPRQRPSRPRLSRSEIHASGIVILDRNSQASSTFLGSPCQSPMRVLAAIDDPRVVKGSHIRAGVTH